MLKYGLEKKFENTPLYAINSHHFEYCIVLIEFHFCMFVLRSLSFYVYTAYEKSFLICFMLEFSIYSSLLICINDTNKPEDGGW